MIVTRRSVIAGASALLGAGVLGFSGLHFVSRREIRRWAERLGEVPLARDLGVEYLYTHADEASEPAILARLDPVSQVSPPGTTGDAAGLRSRLRLDFSDGDLVTVGGWRLARTELRLCALAALNWATQQGAEGIFTPVTLPDGTSVAWTSPRARITVRPTAAGWTLSLRAGAPVPQTAALRVNGTLVDERSVTPGLWHRLHFRSRPADGPTLNVELSTAPEWRPTGDFRTLGVGVGSLWDPA